MADYFDLGGYTRPVATSSAQAQPWFDRGLIWTYGFNHEEAVRCFEQALGGRPGLRDGALGHRLRRRPQLQQALGGVRRAGPGRAIGRTRTTATGGRASAGWPSANPAERALIAALARPLPGAARPAEDCPRWNDAYADAMRAVYAGFRDDLDVAALFAEALMNRTPWQLWDLTTGEPADGRRHRRGEAGAGAGAGAAAAGRVHPGVLHMYIHLMEMSPFPERALRAADRLRGLVPGRRPSAAHADPHRRPVRPLPRCGRSANHAAIVADRKFLEREGAMNFYSLYRAHNYHFKIYGAMFLGQSQTALDAADELARDASPRSCCGSRVPPMADWLEGFVPMKTARADPLRHVAGDHRHAAARRPGALLRDHGHAALRQGRRLRGHRPLAEAERAARAVRAAQRPGCPTPRYLFNNTCRDILASPRRCWTASWSTARATSTPPSPTCAARSSSTTPCPTTSRGAGCSRPATPTARCCWSRAVSRRPRPSTGPTSAWTARCARACQHPDNVWSLHGYHECLMRLGKHEQARHHQASARSAAARADVPMQIVLLLPADPRRHILTGPRPSFASWMAVTAMHSRPSSPGSPAK